MIPTGFHVKNYPPSIMGNFEKQFWLPPQSAMFPKYVGHLFQEWGAYSTPHFMYNDESFEGS
jgi:hypothetical protein